MDAAPSQHPTDRTLTAFGLGKLDADAAGIVGGHLERCAACRQRVASLSADSFLDRVRGAGKTPTPTGASVLGGTLSFHGAAAPPKAETLPPGLADHPDYDVKKELGRGGMGVVYLAHNTLMGRDEVLKVMGRHIMERPGVLERFLREIRAVARLRHDNIVSAYSASRIGDAVVFSMEYVDGLDLARLVKAKGPLPVGHACQFIHQAALGLQHAHEEGLVHRDIKPANLMLSRRAGKPVVKVLDFGLAKAAREEKVDGALTSTGQALGTPDYIAPEQILDAPSADIRADIYSLGGTLYYLLTGRPPFKANSLYDLYQAHISRDADPLNMVRPEVPSELGALVAKMMAKDPSKRFQTPGEVAEALKPFFKKAGASSRPARPDVSQAGPAEPPGPSPRRSAETTQGATQLSGPTAPPKRSPETTVAETPWNDLIAVEEDAPLPTVAPAARRAETPAWVLPTVAAGVLLASVLVAWLVVVRVKTPEGTIVLENLPEKAEVLLDGREVTVHLGDGGTPARITVPPGRRGVQVKKDGFEAFGAEVTLGDGETKAIRVTLDPVAAPEAPRTADVVAPSPPVGSPPKDVPVDSRDAQRERWILAKLDRVVPMKFARPTPLKDVLTYIQSATKLFEGDGFPIYVDPTGLQEADKTMASPVTIDLEGVPLKTSLGLALKSLGLEYCVYDGLLYVGDEEGVRGQRDAPRVLDSDGSRASDAVAAKLATPVALRFAAPTPLVRVLSSITEATKGRDGRPGVPFYVDPGGLEEAEKSINSPVAIDTDEAPLRTTLRLLLAQLGLTYSVKAGVVNITAPGEEANSVAERSPVRPPAAGWVSLFDGKTLNGWSQNDRSLANQWGVRNGEIVAEGKGGAAGQTFLVTDRSFTNFVLRFEFILPKGGNSGVAIRAVPLKFPPVEVNLRNNDAPDPYTGSVRVRSQGGDPGYDVATSPAALLPESNWNAMEIDCRGGNLKISLNGREIHALDLTKLAFRPGALPALTNVSGGVGFQSHTGAARFRNVEILDLSRPASASEPAPAAQARSSEFVPIFNGKTLEGWKQDRGTTPYWHVRDGHLVMTGTGPNNEHTFLLSDRSYSDFVLRFEFSMPKGTDSGVVFRALPGETPSPVEVNLRNFDEDASKAGMAAVRWSEIRNAPGYQNPPTVVPARPESVWNTMEIDCRGDTLKVTANDRQVQTLSLSQFASRPGALAGLTRASGRVGFQSHTGTVRFRKIEIMDLGRPASVGETAAASAPDSPPYVPLFNGRDLLRWTAWDANGSINPAQASRFWGVNGGVLIGSGGPSYLYHRTGDFQDFRLRAEVKINAGGNSGIFFRAGKKAPIPTGYEAQINATHADPNKTGSLYHPPSPVNRVSPSPVPAGEWCTLEVEAIGTRIRVAVNGKTTVDFTETDATANKRGFIAIQAHHPGSLVEIRNLEIQEVGPEGAKAAAKGPPADAKNFIGRQYAVFPEKLTWREAKAKCEGLGGHLAVVTNEGQNRFLTSLMKEKKVETAWLGGTDEKIEGNWLWVDGSPLRYANWDVPQKQPNNKQNLEHYLVILGRTGGTWCDQPDDGRGEHPGFVCQWD